jgi:hypothetical protein
MDVVEPPLELTGTPLSVAADQALSDAHPLEPAGERPILEPGRKAGRF